jgi:ABC-type phosphate transport system permease subunit
MAVAALVLGIVSLVFCFIPGLNFVALIVGIVGIVLGALARKKLKEQNQPSGMATGGLVMSIIGTILGAILWIACVACIGGTGAVLNEVQKEQKRLEQIHK